MAGEEGTRSEGKGRPAFDKTGSVPRSGSIGLVLLVAVLLIGAAAGLVYIGPEYSGLYILALLALLATVGVIALFATAAGILRFSGRDTGHPLLKTVADNDSDGILITDQSGRVFYANAAYLDLIGATADEDVRPIERVFMAKNADSALKLGQARGAAICAAVRRALPVHEYAPTAIKQAVVGGGRADKTQVQHMVGVLLGLREALQADAADALAVAITHAHTRSGTQRIGIPTLAWRRRR